MRAQRSGKVVATGKSRPVAALVLLQSQAGLDGYISVERYIMKKRGIFTSDRMRSPEAWVADDATRAEVDRLMRLLERAVALHGAAGGVGS